MSEHLTVPQIAERIGRSVATIRSARRRGTLPEPDGFTGRTPWWRPETVEAWRERVEQEWPGRAVDRGQR